MPFLCSVPPNIFFSIYSPTSSPSSLSSTLVLHRSRNAEITDCCVIRRGALTPLCRSMELSSFLPFSSLALDASTSVDPDCLTTSVRPLQQSTSLSQWNLGPRHIFLLNIITCTVAISASMLFFSAIPTLLAFKRAAESLEKLMDVTAEELPGTMAAMRLCGMEISDLTMELSDIGQEITQGVKSSTRAIHVAEERLRSLATMNPMVSTQVLNSSKQVETLPLANKARNLRIGIVKGRKLLGIVSSVSQFSKWFSKIFMSGNQRR